MVSNVRIHLGEATQRFFQNSELKHFIGEGFRYYSMIMLEEGAGYFERSDNLGFTAGNEEVSLASLSPAFFSLSQLSRRVTQGTVPLIAAENRFRAKYNIGQGSGDSYLPTYRFRGMNIVLEPEPVSTEAASSTTGLKIEYNYVPTFPSSASADSFTFDTNFSTIYEGNVELWAAIAALESKDAMGGISDIQSLRGRLEKLDNVFWDSLERDEQPDQVDYAGIDYSNPFM